MTANKLCLAQHSKHKRGRISESLREFSNVLGAAPISGGGGVRKGDFVRDEVQPDEADVWRALPDDPVAHPGGRLRGRIVRVLDVAAVLVDHRSASRPDELTAHPETCTTRTKMIEYTTKLLIMK